MPIPAFIAPALAGAQIFAGLWGQERNRSQAKRNLQAQKELNAQQIQFEQQRADQERTWALMDWERTNKYNHPAQQMQRWKEAGLNPHLIYGQGTVTGQPHQTSGASPRLAAPQESVDYSIFPQAINNAATGYLDMEKRAAEITNLKDLNASIRAKTALDVIKSSIASEEVVSKQLKNKVSSHIVDPLILRESLRNEKMEAETSAIGKKLSMQRAELDIKKAALSLKQNEYELKKAKTFAELKDITSRILYRELQSQNIPIEGSRLQASIHQILATTEYKSIETQLKGMGLQPGTPEYIKRYTALFGDLLNGLGAVKKGPSGNVKIPRYNPPPIKPR